MNFFGKKLFFSRFFSAILAYRGCIQKLKWTRFTRDRAWTLIKNSSFSVLFKKLCSPNSRFFTFSFFIDKSSLGSPGDIYNSFWYDFMMYTDEIGLLWFEVIVEMDTKTGKKSLGIFQLFALFLNFFGFFFFFKSSLGSPGDIYDSFWWCT